MPRKITIPLVTGLLGAGLALPAAGQSYRHAPPADSGPPLFTAQEIPLLEQIVFGSSATSDASSPRDAARQPSSRIPARTRPSVSRQVSSRSIIPEHLKHNTWQRLPASIPPAPVAYEHSYRTGRQATSRTRATALRPARPYAAAAPIRYTVEASRQVRGSQPTRRGRTGEAPVAPRSSRQRVAQSTRFARSAQFERTRSMEYQRPPMERPAATQTAAAPRRQEPRRFIPGPSVEPMPVPDSGRSHSPIQLASYVRRPQRRSVQPQQPPVPPRSPLVPAASPPPRQLDWERPARQARSMIQPASGSSSVPPAPSAYAPSRGNSGRLTAMLSDARRALNSGDSEFADEILTQAVETAPHDARPIAVRARLYEMRGDWSKAVSCFDRLIILEPRKSIWPRARARAYFHLQEYAKSIADFRTIEAGGGALSLNDYTILCEAAFRRGDARTVRHALAEIEKINPQPHPRSELIRGLIAFRMGAGAKAREILLRASAIWPKNKALTAALRRTSAVYYQNKQSPPLTAKLVGYQRSGLSRTEAASLQLVKEYTPPVPEREPTPAGGEKPAEEPRGSESDSAPRGRSAEPPRLGMVFETTQWSASEHADSGAIWPVGDLAGGGEPTPLVRTAGSMKSARSGMIGDWGG